MTKEKIGPGDPARSPPPQIMALIVFNNIDNIFGNCIGLLDS